MLLHSDEAQCREYIKLIDWVWLSKTQAAYCNIHTAPVQQHTHAVTGASKASGATPGVAEASEATCRYITYHR